MADLAFSDRSLKEKIRDNLSGMGFQVIVSNLILLCQGEKG